MLSAELEMLAGDVFAVYEHDVGDTHALRHGTTSEFNDLLKPVRRYFP